LKKIISIIITAVLLFSFSTVAFAEDEVKLTDEQKQERAKYIGIHADKKQALMELNSQKEAAVQESSNFSKQIKEKLKSLLVKNNEDSIAKIKANSAETKAIAEQAKTLQQQRLTLLKDLSTALQNKDAARVKEIKAQISGLSDSIKSIKEQVKTKKDSVKEDRDKVKASRDRAAQIKNQVKPILAQAKELNKKIDSEYQAKKALWETYKSNIEAKDYDAAAATLDKIIEAKRQIVADIKARADLLQNALDILSSY